MKSYLCHAIFFDSAANMQQSTYKGCLPHSTLLLVYQQQLQQFVGCRWGAWSIKEIAVLYWMVEFDGENCSKLQDKL